MKFYLIISLFIIVIGAYFTGRKISQTECLADLANAHANEIIQQTNIKRITNAKVFHTGNRDIRRILREKYTIAE